MEKIRFFENQLITLRCGTFIESKSLLKEDGFLKAWADNQKHYISSIDKTLQDLELFVERIKEFSALLNSTDSKKLTLDFERLHSVGIVACPIQMKNENAFDFDKLFKVYFANMPRIQRIIKFQPLWSESKLNGDANILQHSLDRIEDMLYQVEMCETLDSFESNCTTFSERDVSSEYIETQQSDYAEYWKQLVVTTPEKMEQQHTADKKCSQISVLVQELFADNQRLANHTSGRDLFNIGEQSFLPPMSHLPSISVAMVQRSGKLDPMMMLNGTFQRSKFPNNSKINVTRIGRTALGSLEPNNNQCSSPLPNNTNRFI